MTRAARAVILGLVLGHLVLVAYFSALYAWKVIQKQERLVKVGGRG